MISRGHGHENIFSLIKVVFATFDVFVLLKSSIIKNTQTFFKGKCEFLTDVNCGLSVFVIFYSEEIDFLGRYQVSKNQRREGSRSRKQQKTTYGSYYYYIIYIVYYYIYVRTDVGITQLTKRGYFTVASSTDMKKQLL